MKGTRIIPNLFIVGAPKCGTTALSAYLGKHPEIFMAMFTECNHFATDLIPPDDPFRSEEKYRALFSDVKNQKNVGEKSVYYMLSKVAAQNIYRFNPEAKIIIMLRNPVDMLQSHHSQQVYNGDENITDFEEALRAEIGRKNDELKLKENVRIKEKLFYSEVVSYTEQVERYLSLFRGEQIHIIIYDDLKKDTADVYKKTLEFLHVDSTFQPDFPKINARKVRRNNFYSRFINTPYPWKDFVKKLIPKRFQEDIYFTLKRLDSIEVRPPLMNPITKKQLQETYTSEIQKLGIVLGRDLSCWA
jgi:hypothetical protein